MNANDTNDLWMNLLTRSAPTFAGETSVPYGLTTSTLARLRAESMVRKERKKIGSRALLAALAALGLTVVVTLTLDARARSDFDPGVRSLVQLDNLPYS